MVLGVIISFGFIAVYGLIIGLVVGRFWLDPTGKARILNALLKKNNGLGIIFLNSRRVKFKVVDFSKNSFNDGESLYTITERPQVNYRGLPTLVYLEDQPQPLIIYDQMNPEISARENENFLKTVFNAAMTLAASTAETLRKRIDVTFILAVICVIGVAGTLFFVLTLSSQLGDVAAKVEAVRVLASNFSHG